MFNKNPQSRVMRVDVPDSLNWIDVKVFLPPDNKKVMVCTDKRLLFCAVCQKVTVSARQGKAQEVDKWFASPGWGHEITVTHWKALPSLPVYAHPLT